MFTKKHQAQQDAHCAAQDKQVKRHMKKQAVDKSAGHKGHVFAK